MGTGAYTRVCRGCSKEFTSSYGVMYCSDACREIPRKKQILNRQNGTQEEFDEARALTPDEESVTTYRDLVETWRVLGLGDLMYRPNPCGGKVAKRFVLTELEWGEISKWENQRPSTEMETIFHPGLTPVAREFEENNSAEMDAEFIELRLRKRGVSRYPDKPYTGETPEEWVARGGVIKVCPAHVPITWQFNPSDHGSEVKPPTNIGLDD